MSTTQAPPTATGRLRYLLDLIDEVDHRDAVSELTANPDAYAGFEAAYLLGRLRGAAEYALREWEDRA